MTITVLDEVMRAPIQLQCILSYTILANLEMEPHAPNTFSLKYDTWACRPQEWMPSNAMGNCLSILNFENEQT